MQGSATRGPRASFGEAGEGRVKYKRFVRSLEFGQAAQLHILLRTSCACASTRHVPLRSQSTPKMPFYIYVHCS